MFESCTIYIYHYISIYDILGGYLTLGRREFQSYGERRLWSVKPSKWATFSTHLWGKMLHSKFWGMLKQVTASFFRRESSSSNLQLLMGSELFRYLDTSYLAMLSKCSSSIQYPDKAVVRNIDTGSFMYVVKKGQVTLASANSNFVKDVSSFIFVLHSWKMIWSSGISFSSTAMLFHLHRPNSLHSSSLSLFLASHHEPSSSNLLQGCSVLFSFFFLCSVIWKIFDLVFLFLYCSSCLKSSLIPRVIIVIPDPKDIF